MGWRKKLESKAKESDAVIGRLNTGLTLLQRENDHLQQELQKVGAIAAAERDAVLCEYNSVLAEKNQADQKLVRMEIVVCELQEENLIQRNQIHNLQEEVQQQRRTIWRVVSSFFVVAAASLAYAVSRR